MSWTTRYYTFILFSAYYNHLLFNIKSDARIIALKYTRIYNIWITIIFYSFKLKFLTSRGGRIGWSGLTFERSNRHALW